MIRRRRLTEVQGAHVDVAILGFGSTVRVAGYYEDESIMCKDLSPGGFRV